MSRSTAGSSAHPAAASASPALAASAERIARFTRQRGLWQWIALGTGLASLIALAGTFWLTLHYFRSALSAMPGGDGYAGAVPVVAGDVLHSQTTAAVTTLGTGLVVFVVLFLAFLSTAACYVSIRSRLADEERAAAGAERLAAEMFAEAEEAREAAAEDAVARQLGLGPYAGTRTPDSEAPPDDAVRFRSLMDRPQTAAPGSPGVPAPQPPAAGDAS